MTTLALDLGTVTGWAIGPSPIISGTVDFRPRRFEGGGMRYLRFRGWLNSTRDAYADYMSGGASDAICFEEVRRPLGVDAAHAYGGFWCR